MFSPTWRRDIEMNVTWLKPKPIHGGKRADRIAAMAVPDEFGLRSRARAPLLVLDYTHAGAVGFPNMGSFGADLTCGDFAKWVTPPTLTIIRDDSEKSDLPQARAMGANMPWK